MHVSLLVTEVLLQNFLWMNGYGAAPHARNCIKRRPIAIHPSKVLQLNFRDQETLPRSFSVTISATKISFE